MSWFNDLLDTFKVGFYKTKNFTVQHSPELLFAAGTGAVLFGVGMAIKKSLQPNELVIEANNDIKRLEDFAAVNVSNEPGSIYTTEQYKKDMDALMPKTVVAYTVNYIPVGISVALGLLCLYKSNMQYKARSIGAMAIASGTLISFNQYRARVRDRFGADVDYELFNGLTPIATMPDGTEVFDKPQPPEKPTLTNKTARFFDEQSVHFDKNPDANILYIQLMEEQFNNMLPVVDWMSFNQACGKLDLPKDLTPISVPGTNKLVYEGDIIGWKYDKNVTHKISISVLNMGEYNKRYNPHTEMLDDHMYDGDAVLYLDFNCTDVLTDYMAI